MKRTLVFLVALTIAALFTSQNVWTVKSMELFGNGHMIGIVNDSEIKGVIVGWGVWVVNGSPENCFLVPLYSPQADAQRVSCKIKTNEKGMKFSGVVYYRESARSFCGALNNGDLPRSCRGEFTQ